MDIMENRLRESTEDFGSLSEDEQEQPRNEDRDSLHILPLSILPLETKALRGARLIKNVRLDSVIEFFGDSDSGSGQLDVESLTGEFGWPESPPHPDLVMMRGLAPLPTYDVYSLRILLREQGIKVNDVDALKLSSEKMSELTSYMTDFTHPLIVEIYGGDNMEIHSFEDVLKLFRDPDVEKARTRLQQMADKLEIDLLEVPKFLEDYGDIFLSLSYYRSCLDGIEPHITDFLETLEELKQNWQLRNDQNLMKTCKQMQETINELMAATTGRFESFDRASSQMWSEISAKRFRRVENLIKSMHTTIGGMLCALSVKMDTWNRLFPDKNVGGPVKRSEFVLSDMRQGIDKIIAIEANAPPMLANLDDAD